MTFMTISSRIDQEINRAWESSASLTATCLLMLVAFLVSLIGIAADHRIITGVPAWLKPAKFAISTAIFTGTLAWFFRFITVWPKFVSAMGWIIGVIITLEVALIDIQAMRGTTSHFNVATPADGILFSVMGTAIGILWLASIGVLAALFHQKFADQSFGWSLRLGMLITILGSASGGLMLRATHEQTEVMRTGQSITSHGGHTVGAPDGGPGLPGLGWSSRHGDLRIPHFFGMHGIQIMPLLYWLVLRRRNIHASHLGVRLIFTMAISYCALVAILAWQALRGQSIIEPDETTVAIMSVWLAGTAAALMLSRISDKRAISSTALSGL
jgi:hypothetical protein